MGLEQDPGDADTVGQRPGSTEILLLLTCPALLREKGLLLDVKVASVLELDATHTKDI